MTQTGRRPTDELRRQIETLQAEVRQRERTEHEIRDELANAKRERGWTRVASAATALAAVGALIFTGLSLRQTSYQTKLSESGQVTDRLNAAIANLGSTTLDLRLGGIYALQRLMQDSHRDQPVVIELLSTFIRDHAPTATHPYPFQPKVSDHPKPDIQAALRVLGSRDTSRDGGTKIDLRYADLRGADLRGTAFPGTGFELVDFTGADLADADMSKAGFSEAGLSGARLEGTDLSHANLSGADLTSAYITSTTKLSGASVANADFRNTDWCPDWKPLYPSWNYTCEEYFGPAGANYPPARKGK